MFIIGINEALGASAAILKDGEIIVATLEERFTRIKNHWGFPKNAIRFCCDFASIQSKELDLVVVSYADPYPHFTAKRAVELASSTPKLFNYLRDLAPRFEYRFPLLNQLTDCGRSIYYNYYAAKNRQIQIAEITRFLKISPANLVFVNHHLCHAYTAFYANPNFYQPTLVLTCDGAGDNLCATVYVVSHNDFKLVAKTPHIHSLGLLYASVTAFLGLKAHEDEYKVMGLAPYAKDANWQKIYDVFDNLLWVNSLTFQTKIPARQFDFYLAEKLQRFRFDYVAAAIQEFLEDRLVEWVGNAVTQTGVKNVVVSGGVFLNVKANHKLSQLKSIKHIFFAPSCGDDSNAIGACYYGFKKIYLESTPKPLTSLYLGPEFSDEVAYKIYNNYKLYKYYNLTKPKNINQSVARLLAKGEIVARFVGRMEFGARALGNRSILADPRNREVVEKINRMIKMRDFWMPFAPTILDSYASKYLINPKKLASPFMIVGFEITKLGQRDLAAAIHPFDKSCRPQILRRVENPEYYDLIIQFSKLTEVGALLNTSYNIHGEPIVCSPNDALSTFARSGLKYLQLNNFLIQKTK